MVADPVADTLIRIKNGYLVGKQTVSTRYSKLVHELCKVLEKEGFISGSTKKDQVLEVSLLYKERKPVLTDVKRISKPSLRIYKGVRSLPSVLNGLGIAIISTPKGLMTDKQARKLNVGGEILAYIW